MCYFITLAVPSEHVETLRHAVRPSFKPGPVANRSILSLLPQDYETFLLTSDGCSCGLYYPESASRPSSKSPERLRKKYAKKGWSEAKIQRAIESCDAAYSQREKEVGFSDDVIYALSGLAECVGRLAVFVHWYSGDVETEGVTALSPPMEVDTADLARAMPQEDRLLWVRAG